MIKLLVIFTCPQCLSVFIAVTVFMTRPDVAACLTPCDGQQKHEQAPACCMM